MQLQLQLQLNEGDSCRAHTSGVQAGPWVGLTLYIMMGVLAAAAGPAGASASALARPWAAGTVAYPACSSDSDCACLGGYNYSIQ